MTRAPLHVAFATCRALPEVTADDRLLAEALARRGIAVRGVPWDADVDWTACDAVVLRSTWDFHHRLPAFTGWIAELDARGVRLFNPPRLVAWNVTKRYLRELADKGVTIVPTHWTGGAGDGRDCTLAGVASARRWHAGVVVKPVVSASAHDTWVARGTDGQAEEARFRQSLARASHGVMLQPFLAEIATAGEWSLLFVAGAYSHAVLKRPAAGDFRVQRDYGGTAEPRMPPAALVADASCVLRAAADATRHRPEGILYARVDGVELDGRLVLMEFEAVEPALFLGTDPAAAERLAAALHDALVAGTPRLG